MTTKKTIILSILTLVAFTNVKGALYTVTNDSDTPVTVKIDTGNLRTFYHFTGRWGSSSKTLTADLQPGETTQLNAGGGHYLRTVDLFVPGSRQEIPSSSYSSLSNFSISNPVSGKWKSNMRIMGDKTIKLTHDKIKSVWSVIVM